MREKLLGSVIFIILILAMQMAIIPVKAEGRPDWAREGVLLVYCGTAWEYVPEEELESKIEELKQMPGDCFRLKLLSVDERKALILISSPRETAEWEFYWEESYWKIGNQIIDILPIYKPISRLTSLPLVEVMTPLGAFKAYVETIERDDGSRIIYWYHKDTGILLQFVILSQILRNPYTNELSRDVTVYWLHATMNIPDLPQGVIDVIKEPITAKETAKITETITKVITLTNTVREVMTVTTANTITRLETTTHVITVTMTLTKTEATIDWAMTTMLAIALLIVGMAIGWFIKRKHTAMK